MCNELIYVRSMCHSSKVIICKVRYVVLCADLGTEKSVSTLSPYSSILFCFSPMYVHYSTTV